MIRLALLLVAISLPDVAQTVDPSPTAATAAVPTVTFTLSWQQSNPSWFEVAIQSTGTASYRSTASEATGGLPADPYMVEFTASEATRKKIFQLAKEANYFQGDFDFKKGRIARTGDKTLIYQDGTRRTQTTFNWSQNQPVQQLADLFQDISVTMEFGRKLEHLYRFEKLGVDRELKRMEELKRSGKLIEVQALEPILKRIANDKTIVNVGRQRAFRLMGMSDAPARSVVNGR